MATRQREAMYRKAVDQKREAARAEYSKPDYHVDHRAEMQAAIERYTGKVTLIATVKPRKRAALPLKDVSRRPNCALWISAR